MGTISLLGSAYVIQDILRNEQKRKHTFHRVMVGLSITDILSSFFIHILATAPMPKGYFVLAAGSVATCDTQGFFTTMSKSVTALYNCSLTTYYLVQLRYNWPNKRVKALEKWLHIVPWSVGLVQAFAALALKLYGPNGFNCMPTAIEYPIECTFDDSPVECIRGNRRLGWLFFLVFLFITFLAICYISVTMFMVYRSVSSIEIQAHLYSFASYKSQKSDRKRSRRVMLQGVLYSLALFLSYIFVVIEVFRNKMTFDYNVVIFIFWPLQGFFNALIYSIPVFQRTYKRWKDGRERKERQTITTLVSVQEAKSTNNQEIVSSSVESNKMAFLSSNSNSGKSKGNSSRYSCYQQHQSTLTFDKTIEEEGAGNKDYFDEEEVKADIQERNEGTTDIHQSGKIKCDDGHQFQLINSNDVESNIIIDDAEQHSGGNEHHDHHDDSAEIKGETQEGINYVVAHHRHPGADLTCQSEDNFESSVNNNADDDVRDYNNDDSDNDIDYNDIDDYIVLSSKRYQNAGSVYNVAEK